MLTVLSEIHLQTLISQVDLVRRCFRIVVGRGSSEVALAIVINPKVFSDQGPHSDIKLPLFIKEWPLNVFLNNAQRIFLAKNKVRDLLCRLENLDSSPLVQAGRLTDPHILFAMFDGHSFETTTTSRYLSEPLQELVYFSFICCLLHNISGWRCVERSVVFPDSWLVLCVVVVQRPYEVCF